MRAPPRRRDRTELPPASALSQLLPHVLAIIDYIDAISREA